METFGERLRFAREDRGLAVETVAETLGVDPESLRALERNDFRVLPDEAFVSRCLEEYARCLDVDAELMTADYLQERERVLGRLDQTVARVADRGSSILPRWIAVAVVLAAIAFAVSWWFAREEKGGIAVAEPVVVAPPAKPSPVEPAATPADIEPAATASPAKLTIAEAGVGTAVRRRKLVGVSDRFRVGERVWFWNRVVGGSSGDRIEHVWYLAGEEVSRIPLDVGGSNWRTYSSKTLRGAGNWSVEAVDRAGRVLVRREFVSR